MSPGRLRSLDVFRGLTIAAMIVVNSPGNEHAYAMLEHASWNGLTPTDWVFPFFLFIVGLSLVLSLEKRLAAGSSRSALLSVILRRAAILFGLGLLMNGFPQYSLPTIRIPGVLQRIALGYLFGSLIYLYARTPGWIVLLVSILAGYWALMTRVPVPGFGAGDLSVQGNLAAWIDRLVLGGHLYRPHYDPEGILTTLPAIGTVLIGMLTARWLESGGTDQNKLTGLMEAGILFLILGWKWGAVFPVNKALWTSSYVLVTAGIALLVLSALYAIIDMKGAVRWARPFEIFGTNAIAAYVLHILFLKIQNRILIPEAGGASVNLRVWLTQHAFGTWMTPENASLAYALSYLGLWMLVVWGMNRKQILLKV